MIRNYSCNYERTREDRKQQMSVHYSNDVQTITQTYFDACTKAGLDARDCTRLDTPMRHRFLVFVPYCAFFKPYIRECLASIRDQTYRTYTVVVVDDGNDAPKWMAALQTEFSFVLLKHATRLGPAASKWTFFQHVQQMIKKGTYTANDIVVILDGDDYLQTVCALAIIHNRYLDTKCKATFGESTGKFSKTSRDAWRKRPKTAVFNVRDKWMYNHPRTFKAELVHQFHKRNFQQDGTELWLTKCTDRPIVYGMFEHFGVNNVQHIDTALYCYREHANNTYKLVPSNEKQAQLKAILKRPPLAAAQEDIHVVMCCWKRVDNLQKQFENMNNQTVAKRIVFHLVNNNAETRKLLEQKVKAQHALPTNKLRVVLTHWSNKHFGFERFYYIRDYLVNRGVSYVIIIDDDQLFANNWVEQLYNKRKPKHYITWYGRRWTSKRPVSYWKDGGLKMEDCLHNHKPSITHFNYGGTGGSIIDMGIFQKHSKLWKVSTQEIKHSVFKIEDLWLSFVVTQKYNWSIERSFLPEAENFNKCSKKSCGKSLYLQLKTQKTQFLHYLIDKGKWSLQ